MGMGLTAPCADQEKSVCCFVSATISSAVMGAVVSVVVISFLLGYGVTRLRGYEEDPSWSATPRNPVTS